ncbi:MAG: hypothetical protein GXP18_00890 [Gammaproteobacteria bacterium]|nr:hypothetical protein [Gammaproteobacteria bacterium]
MWIKGQEGVKHFLLKTPSFRLFLAGIQELKPPDNRPGVLGGYVVVVLTSGEL